MAEMEKAEDKRRWEIKISDIDCPFWSTSEGVLRSYMLCGYKGNENKLCTYENCPIKVKS
jgi:hypothetical protein